MKNLLIIAVMTFLSFGSYAQETQQAVVSVGDEYVIKEPSTGNFKHLHFPKSNFVRKKGGTPNYKRIFNMKVKVAEVQTQDNGDQLAVLKPADGGKFFNTHPTITADISKALQAGELGN